MTLPKPPARRVEKPFKLMSGYGRLAAVMPSRSTSPDVIRGLSFRLVPNSRFRRTTRIPFYIESLNETFRINIERVGDESPEDPWPNGEIEVDVVFSDGNYTPHLQKGAMGNRRAYRRWSHTHQERRTKVRLKLPPPNACHCLSLCIER